LNGSTGKPPSALPSTKVNLLMIFPTLGSKAPFDSLLGAMNPKLSMAFMGNLMAHLSTQMVDPDPCATETMFQIWWSDSVAASHSNILCIACGNEPMLWIYAPFQSQPLGKPLPSIMSMCSCPGLPVGELKPLRRAKSHKEWEVDHNGADGVALCNVVVKATCTLCQQVWLLPSEHLARMLRKYSRNFAALMPYFAPLSS
jgi:hypothetical protein